MLNYEKEQVNYNYCGPKIRGTKEVYDELRIGHIKKILDHIDNKGVF